jgi:hypothetical protein
VEIKLPQGAVTLAPEAAKSLAGQVGDGSVSVGLETVSASSLNERQKEAVKDAPVYDISVSSGSKTISSFDGGKVSIGLPYTLKAGQDPAGVVVRHIDDVGNTQDMETKYDARAKTVSFTTDHLSLYAIAYDETLAVKPWQNPFSDVRADDWFYSDVEYAYSNGLITGVTDTSFAPQTTLTRAMLVTILYRREMSIHNSQFTTHNSVPAFDDVTDGQWYSEAIAWAAANGIVNGVGENKFAPDEPVTREQFAAVLLRYAEFAGGGPQGGWAVRLDFADVGEISDWAVEGAMYCYMQGIITGKPGNLFDPRGGATRAEAAAMLRRFID